jgi:hypothetical protein
MSSWASGRIHFREKKTIVTSVHVPTNNVTNNINIDNKPPSKFIFSKKSNNIDAVICAIALNEERYIDEWIKYNLLLGFSHIYIYDNSYNNILKDKKSDRVTIIHYPGIAKQLEAYNIFILQYKKRHTWCAFIDCDEFIVLKKHDNIISLLNDYDDCASIALNWIMFGTSNEKEYRDEPVTKRFTYCSNKIDIHIKSITKLLNINNYISPHFPQLKNGYNFDTNRNIIPESLNPNGDATIAYIHHYYTKSEQEFREKIERGCADIIQKRSLDELNDVHSKNNDIYNSDAWDFYSKHL